MWKPSNNNILSATQQKLLRKSVTLEIVEGVNSASKFPRDPKSIRRAGASLFHGRCTVKGSTASTLVGHHRSHVYVSTGKSLWIRTVPRMPDHIWIWGILSSLSRSSSGFSGCVDAMRCVLGLWGCLGWMISVKRCQHEYQDQGFLNRTLSCREITCLQLSAVVMFLIDVHIQYVTITCDLLSTFVCVPTYNYI